MARIKLFNEGPLIETQASVHFNIKKHPEAIEIKIMHPLCEAATPEQVKNMAFNFWESTFTNTEKDCLSD